MKVKIRVKTLIIGFILFLLLCFFIKRTGQSKETDGNVYLNEMREELGRYVEERILFHHLPIFAYAGEEQEQKLSVDELLKKKSPIWELVDERKDTIAIESSYEIDELILREGQDEDSEKQDNLNMEQDGEGIIHLNEETKKQLALENEAAREQIDHAEDILPVQDTNFSFTPRIDKMQQYQWDFYHDTDSLIKGFYAIDASTELTDIKLSAIDMQKRDMKIAKDNTNPQILIYHTHSQEGFADSVTGDDTTTVMGAGERLKNILETTYGFNVYHHEGKYDVETRDYAYSEALPNIEEILQKNPSIEVVIDLHRDAVGDDKKLLTEIDGRQCAQFMFFNGLSRTKKQGAIDYLKNPYIEDNLAFSFQMQVLCNEYYPGITRKIYLKGYRYNMHLCPKTLLIEMGAQTNTNKEIDASIDILAHVLAMELYGEEYVNDMLKGKSY